MTDDLLTPQDPAPVDWVNADSAAPVLLLCEHAGQAIPRALGDLGVPRSILDDHYGWDIGAAALARQVAETLGAPLILQRYSRLVIDCNRPPGAPGSIPAVSNGVPVPGNADLTEASRTARVTGIFAPLDRAIQSGFARHPRRAALSIHSFTPELHGQLRPWHAGFLARRDPVTGAALMASISANAPETTLALNQPYQIDDEDDWFIPAHAEPRGTDHCLIEIRNDQLRTETGVARWADLLSRAIAAHLETRP